ncbi:unnamed protein product [Nippostrongylus brasiliensis]|uniref:Chromatin remodeling protein n=1 Tax=Nippostrongylus brasiliensis TaxID=27835 RepID=A0A0N4YH29_NIPBR|nr:unnamed protein product [Nippostrongylus brasiliensis]
MPSGFSSPPTEVQAPTVQPSQSAGPIPTPQSSGSVGTPPASSKGTEALSTSPSVSSVSGSTDGSVDLQMKAKASKKKRYTGEIHLQSKCVGKFVLVYRIPGTSDAYTFIPERDCESSMLYRCRGCDWLNAKRRKLVTIKPKPIRKRVGPRKSVGGPQKEEEPPQVEKKEGLQGEKEPPQVEKKEEPQKEEEPGQVEPRELGDLDLD